MTATHSRRTSAILKHQAVSFSTRGICPALHSDFTLQSVCASAPSVSRCPVLGMPSIHALRAPWSGRLYPAMASYARPGAGRTAASPSIGRYVHVESFANTFWVAMKDGVQGWLVHCFILLVQRSCRLGQSLDSSTRAGLGRLYFNLSLPPDFYKAFSFRHHISAESVILNSPSLSLLIRCCCTATARAYLHTHMGG